MREKKCDNEDDVCYAVWHIDANGTRTVEMQGCWPNGYEQSSCYRDQCINSRAQTSNSIHRFCCCTSNMCNVNMTEYTVPTDDNRKIFVIDHDIPTAYDETILSALNSARLWIVVFVISIPLLLSILYVVLCRNRLKSNRKVIHVLSQQNISRYSADLLNVDNLKLCTMIGRGKYGTVWQGMLNEQSIAVKIFPSHYKDYFLNEKDMYCLPAMNTTNFLEYFGCDERRTLEDNIEYLLVLGLAPLGCLQEWLTQTTASFDVYTKMSRSIAAGLSHLHTPQHTITGHKPCIVHRDLNSRNILVKSDLSCCICDFGFALKTVGPRYEWKGVVTLAEQKSLVEVGTVRYMAPEMLEGAVNLRDCETALKQVDIYSLGLVLWELFTRCHEFYTDDEPMPPYKQPYENEVGKMPSLEQMQILVSRQKVRPKFPNAWKRNVSAKVGKDTCEDCWDTDPDARLTALCVEERLREISTYRLQSPTVAELRPEHQFQAHSMTAPMQNSNGCALASPNVNKTFVECHNEIGTISNGTMSSVSEDLNLYRNGKFGERAGGKGFVNLGLDGNHWTRIRSLFAKTVLRQPKHLDEVSILTDDNRSVTKTGESQPPTSIYQNSNLLDNNRVHMKTKHLPQVRPKHLELALPHINAPESGLLQSDLDSPSAMRNYQSIIKRSPGDFPSPLQPSIREVDESDGSQVNQSRRASGIVASKSTGAMRTLPVANCSDEWHIKRQRSLEVFRDVFGVKGSVERLRDPSERIKTPGDVPKSVRKVRATKTLSLYDDRMMNISSTGSV